MLSSYSSWSSSHFFVLAVELSCLGRRANLIYFMGKVAKFTSLKLSQLKIAAERFIKLYWFFMIVIRWLSSKIFTLLDAEFVDSRVRPRQCDGSPRSFTKGGSVA